MKNYFSLGLLFAPAFLFVCFLFLFFKNVDLFITHNFPYLPWQFIVIAITGTFATTGGVLDWRFHRKTLQLKISKKERLAEAFALGFGGLPMFFLMWFAMNSTQPNVFLIPIIIVLIFTVSIICYDEFVFHRKRCGQQENIYHRMLVFGNGLAWLAWFHFIYIK